MSSLPLLRQRDVFTGTRQRPAPREWSRRWGYDHRNNLIREEHDDNPFRWRHWQYDASGRLLKQEGVQTNHEWWQWDAASNPLDDSTEAVSHNRVTKLNGAEYRYDVHGRTVEKRYNGERWRFSYDGEHRLSQVVREARYGAQTQVSFRYDPLGRRISKTSRRSRAGEEPGKPETTYFVWEGLRLLQEIRYGSPLTWVYTDQHGYEPLAQIRGVKEPEILWYHCHPNGTPERLTDEEGNLRWHGHNSAWGKLLREERLSGPYYTDNLRMQGQYLDRETGLHYNLFRYYDPDCGRFTQPDPIGLAGGLNLYQYAPNALGWVDPLGLTPEDLVRYKPHDSLTAQSGARSSAITRAWVQEKIILQSGASGSREWTSHEREFILKTPNKNITTVMSRAGYTGHHINSVEGNGALGGKWQSDPRNIIFLQNHNHLSGVNEHVHGVTGHRGNTKNSTNGRLIDREATLKLKRKCS